MKISATKATSSTFQMRNVARSCKNRTSYRDKSKNGIILPKTPNSSQPPNLLKAFCPKKEATELTLKQKEPELYIITLPLVPYRFNR